MGARAGRHRPPGVPHVGLTGITGLGGCPADATQGRGVATYVVRLLARPSAVTRADRAPPGAARCGRITSIVRLFWSMWVGYEPSVHSCSVRSWKVVSVRGSSPRSRADLLILARTVKPSACLSVTICSACAWTADPACQGELSPLVHSKSA